MTSLAYALEEQLRQHVQKLGDESPATSGGLEKQLLTICHSQGDQAVKFLLKLLVEEVDWFNERVEEIDAGRIQLLRKLCAQRKTDALLCAALQSEVSVNRRFLDRFMSVFNPSPAAELALLVGLLHLSPEEGVDNSFRTHALRRILQCLQDVDTVTPDPPDSSLSAGSAGPSPAPSPAPANPAASGTSTLPESTIHLVLTFVTESLNSASPSSTGPAPTIQIQLIMSRLRLILPKALAESRFPDLYAILWRQPNSNHSRPSLKMDLDHDTSPTHPGKSAKPDRSFDNWALSNPAQCLRECGPRATASVEICEAFLNLFAKKPLNELDVAKMAARVLHKPDPAAPPPAGASGHLILEAVLRNITNAQPDSNASPDNFEWNPVHLIAALRKQKHLDWTTVWHSLDHPGFHVPHAKGAKALIGMIQRSFRGPSSIESRHDVKQANAMIAYLLFKHKWASNEGHLSLIANTLHLPWVYRLSPEQLDPLPSGITEEESTLEEGPWIVWRSLDLVKRLLVLAGTDCCTEVRAIFEQPMGECPALLLCSLSAVEGERKRSTLRQELLDKLVPAVLVVGPKPSKEFVNRLWENSQDLVVKWLRRIYHEDRSRLSRILDLLQDLPSPEGINTVLSPRASVLSSRDPEMLQMEYKFIFDLACVLSAPPTDASRGGSAGIEPRPLEPWLTRTLGDLGDPGARACLKVINQNHSRPESKAKGSRAGPKLSSETIAAVFKGLRSQSTSFDTKIRTDIQHLLAVCLGSMPELAKYNVGDSPTGAAGSKDAGIDLGVTSENLEESVNGFFEKLYDETVSLDKFLDRIRLLKTNSNQLFNQVLISLLDESRFHDKYPDKQLQTTADLYGNLINGSIIEGKPLGLALRCVLTALKKDSQKESKLFNFGVTALRHFVGRTEQWPQYFSIVMQIPNLKTRHPELVRKIEAMLSKDKSGILKDGKSGAKIHWGQQLNIDSLLKNPEKAVTEIDKESRDKIHFIINNVSRDNTEDKGKELGKILKKEHYQYFAQYLVTKRVSVESNHQENYLQLLNYAHLKGLNEAIINSTYDNINLLLSSKEIIQSSSERTLLRNLGSWLGKMTIAKTRVLRKKKIDIKKLILEAFDQERLIVVIPFMCKILESCKESAIFQPPNPWLTGILSLLAELYSMPQLKLTLQFEIEKLFTSLNLEVKKMTATNIIKRRKQENIAAQIQDKMKDFGISEKISPNSLLSGLDAYVTLDEASIRGVYGPSVRTERTSGPVMALNRIVCHALDKAIKEIIQAVVERSVHIACITTKELVQKDFVLEADGQLMKRASHQMVQSLTGALALVTCKEPLRNAICSVLKSLLKNIAEVEDGAPLEKVVKKIAQENLELGCSLIQKAAADQAVREINNILTSELQSRATNRDRSLYQQELFRSGRFPNALPDALRPTLSGLTQRQAAIYEEYNNVQRSRFYDIVKRNAYHNNYALRTNATDANAGTSTNVASTLQQLIQLIEEIHSKALAVRGSEKLHISTLNNDDQLVATLRRFPPIMTQHLNRLSQKSHHESAQVLALFPQKMIEKTWQSIENNLVTDVNVAVLALLKSKSLVVVEKVTEFMQNNASKILFSSNNQPDTRPRLPVERLLMMLARERLINVEHLDQWMAAVHDPPRTIPTPRTMDFIVHFVRTLVLTEDNYTASEFQYTLRMLSTFAEMEQKLGRLVPSQSIGWTIILLLKELEAQRSLLALQTAPFAPDSAEIPEKILEPLRDPNGFRQKIIGLFDIWLHNFPTMTDTSMEEYLRRLQQLNCLKGEIHSERFFRNMIEVAIDKTLATGKQTIQRNSAENQTAKRVVVYDYDAIDGFCKLFSFLVRYVERTHLDGRPFNRYTFLKLFLRVMRNCLIRAWKKNPDNFNQRIYYRFLISILHTRKTWDNAEGKKDTKGPDSHLQTLALFAQLYHDLRPERCPSFVFAWVELISHRNFMPQLLTLDKQLTKPGATGKDVCTRGRRLFHVLLADLLRFQYPHLARAQLHPITQLLYKGTLRILLVLLHDFPEFLCEFYFSFCDVVPNTCVQLRNLILSAFPRKMRLPDPFMPNLKVDLLPEINEPPTILSDKRRSLEANPECQELLKRFLGRTTPEERTNPNFPFYGRLCDLLLLPQAKALQEGCRYNLPLINAVVLEIGQYSITQIKLKSQHANRIMDIFINLVYLLDHDGRYFMLNSIANHLRYPNNNTHFFSCVLLILFETDNDVLKEAITRVLLERLIVHRPHPWGLLITFIELIKNPHYKFWDHGFTRCAPEIERLFESVSRSCMQSGSSAPNKRATKVA